MGFTVFRSCMTVLICLFLLMLFLVPSAYLDRFCAEADARIEAAESALLSGDLPAAAPHCAALFSLVRERMPVLERFLNHASIDALDAAVFAVDPRADPRNRTFFVEFFAVTIYSVQIMWYTV